ncbi:MAG: Uma2 family endonuclease [Nitrospirae bacterium]|nr:Uma2 family endonuclease [Nitrospirota bacterium]
MATATVQTRRFSRKEYDRMVEAGIFGPGERLELVEGEIVRMTPQGSVHATGIQLAQETLGTLFRAGFLVRVQMPLALGSVSEPEPDIAVVPGSPRDFRQTHPAMAALIVEVSDSTLAFDRQTKGRLYAEAGIPEYWIVNLIDGKLEVYREPTAPAKGTAYYREILTLGPSNIVSPLAAPGSSIRVADLLP